MSCQIVREYLSLVMKLDLLILIIEIKFGSVNQRFTFSIGVLNERLSIQRST
jgi:hypothetical protein